jgi:hypothetical protein
MRIGSHYTARSSVHRQCRMIGMAWDTLIDEYGQLGTLRPTCQSLQWRVQKWPFRGSDSLRPRFNSDPLTAPLGDHGMGQSSRVLVEQDAERSWNRTSDSGAGRRVSRVLNVVRALWHQLFLRHVTPFRVLFRRERCPSSTTRRRVSYGDRLAAGFPIRNP